MLIFILLMLIPQQPEIVTCTFEKDNSVLCGNIRHNVSNLAAEDLDKWRERVPVDNNQPNYQAPLIKVDLHAGDRVKARFVDGQLVPIEQCEVRVWKSIRKWREGGREGERMPNSLRTLPDDCQAWYGKQ